MKKAVFAGLAATMFFAVSSAALAEDPKGAQAKATVFYSHSTTVLKAEAMTFSPKFDIKGDYVGVLLESPLKYKRFGVSGAFLQGTSEDIAGAADFVTSGYNPAYYATFNPLTDETIKKLSVNLTFTALDYQDHTGHLDFTAGRFLLESQPGISKGNTFGGYSFGVAGGYDRQFGIHGIGINGTFSYVPTFFVHGNVEGQFTQDYIMEYRLGLEYTLMKHYGLTLGYQGMYLRGIITDQTKAAAEQMLGKSVSNAAIVTATGLYFGVVAKF